MTRQEKNEAIESLKEALGGVKNLYLADIAGLDAKQTSNLRRACFKQNIKLQVVKNTLLAKAMEASVHDFGELTGILKGNTSLMFSESGNAPAKVIKNFRKKSDKPILKLILNGSEISSLKNVPTSLPSTLFIISPTSHPYVTAWYP